MLTGDGKTDAEFEEGTEVCFTSGSARPDVRVCASAHRGVAQQPEEVDQDAQQLCAGGWKQGLPTLLQQPWLPSSGLLLPFKASIT